jgi:Kef-type K+ transport system membrane component KefB
LEILSLQIPFTEPVIIIALLLSIILIGPVVFERIRIPSIVGLLLSGALIGQHGFNLVGSDLEFSLLGTMGLLYLMFLAGLEIDLIDFIENKIKSIFIGLASFLVPFLLGFLVSRHLLDYSVHASWLIGAMLSSHTLISYPLMGRLGIVNKSIVTIIVGATIIADILALVSMELIINFYDKGLEVNAMLQLAFGFLLFFLLIFLVVPRLSRYFLNRYEGELGVQYIFVMVMLFLSAGIAFLLEIEPILGAFFSGLVLNRQIITTSPLYKRIEFIGQNLFIPVFLISIGMLANFRVYIDDPRQVWLLIVLIIAAVVSKYLAAYISKLVFRLSKAETNLVFGMSVSRAASAVAIILIGFNVGFISESILNNTVILILVTSILSTYVTQKSGTQILLKGNDTTSGKKRLKQKILVPVANPANMDHLLEFALLIKQDDDQIPIYPLTVFTQRDQVRNQIDDNQGRVLKVIDSLQTDVQFETGSRIDNSVTHGIVKAAEEIVATAIVIGWNNRHTPFYTLFGNVLSNLLRKTRRMLLVLKTPSELRKIRSIHLFCADKAQYEEGFSLWIDTIMFMIKRLQIKVILYCETQSTFDAVFSYCQDNGNAKYLEEKKSYTGKLTDAKIRQSASDLLIFVHSRKKTVSYSRKYENFMNNSINAYTKNNIIIIYPEY